MFVPFDNLSATARIWVYQSNRTLNGNERDMVESELKAFCSQWQAHGAPLTSSFQLLYDQFLILSVDESSVGASGCSIDGSVHLLKMLGQKLGLDFFDRTVASFLSDDKVERYSLSHLKELFANGTLKSSDIAFNTMVATKDEFLRSWTKPVSEMWLSRYLPKKALA